MPFRAALRGILQRTHSTSSTPSTSKGRRASESEPKSSGVISASASRTDVVEHSTARDSLADVEAIPNHIKVIIERRGPSSQEDEWNPDSSLDCLTTTAEAQNPGPSSPRDRRLADEVKLQRQTPAAKPTSTSAVHDPLATQQQKKSGADHGGEKSTSSLTFHCPTPDRIDNHVGDLPEAQFTNAGNTSISEPQRQAGHRAALFYGERLRTESLTAISPRSEDPIYLAAPPLAASTSGRRGRPQSFVAEAITPVLRGLPPTTPSNFTPSVSASPSALGSGHDHLDLSHLAHTTSVQMSTRKIWVKRPGASATLVAINEDDLVDDVRDMILRKYANSLGRSFDSPDVTLRIVSRADASHGPVERLLGPDEDMCRTLDTYYKGGQTVDEALIIDVPTRRTPRPSPRAYHAPSNAAAYHALDDFRPPESGSDYFPPMPVAVPAVIPPSASHSTTSASADVRSVHGPILHPDQRSISVLSTGQLPPLPSPGSMRRHRDHPHRPKYPRQHTSSPTILSANAAAAASSNQSNLAATQHLPVRAANRPRTGSNAADQHNNGIPIAPALPTPPAPEAPPNAKELSTPPTPNVRDAAASRSYRPRRSRKTVPAVSSPGAAKNAIPSNLLDNSVPPINVLIVEDNMINLKLLEAFMKRLKVRWSTAMNGQIAVNKWRAGGFHLVLMDIQLPIMSGLEATKEIRRLERVNGIGVFSDSALSISAALKQRSEALDATGPGNGDKPKEESEDDKLNVDDGLFKSPVIIVALTASSLQSDRHEALAAGCNDFLTKPVNFVWLERKVKEWGCMQALIDFDGWRKWKDFTSEKEKKAKKPTRVSLEGASRPAPGASDVTATKKPNAVLEEVSAQAA